MNKTMIVFGADGIAAALEQLRPGQQVMLAGTVVQGKTGVGIRACIVSTGVAVRQKCPAAETRPQSRRPDPVRPTVCRDETAPFQPPSGPSPSRPSGRHPSPRPPSSPSNSRRRPSGYSGPVKYSRFDGGI